MSLYLDMKIDNYIGSQEWIEEQAKAISMELYNRRLSTRILRFLKKLFIV